MPSRESEHDTDAKEFLKALDHVDEEYLLTNAEREQIADAEAKAAAVGAGRAPDLAYQVFSTDARALSRAREKYELPQDCPQADVVGAVRKLHRSAKDGNMPEAGWLGEAQELAERVGKPWYDSPSRTIIAALRQKDGLTPLGLPSKVIPFGGETFVHVQSQVNMSLRYLVLSEEASQLTIGDIRVGMCSAFASAEPISGELFGPRAFPFRLYLGQVRISQNVSLYLRNAYGKNIQLGGCFLGKVVPSKGFMP